MQVVEVLSVNEQVQHVVSLTTNLQPNLHPVQLCGLEKLGRFERSEEVSVKKKDYLSY